MIIDIYTSFTQICVIYIHEMVKYSKPYYIIGLRKGSRRHFLNIAAARGTPNYQYRAVKLFEYNF